MRRPPQRCGASRGEAAQPGSRNSLAAELWDRPEDRCSCRQHSRRKPRNALHYKRIILIAAGRSNIAHRRAAASSLAMGAVLRKLYHSLSGKRTMVHSDPRRTALAITRPARAQRAAPHRCQLPPAAARITGGLVTSRRRDARGRRARRSENAVSKARTSSAALRYRHISVQDDRHGN